VAPAAHQSGPIKRPLEWVPPRSGSSAPSSGFRLARGLTPPSSAPAPTRGYEHLCSDTAGPRHHAPGNHAPALFRQLPGGSPSPTLWGTVRRGRCQLRYTVPPTLVRLTRRALVGGPAAPSSLLFIALQGQTVTSGRRSAIPVAVSPVLPSLPLHHHAMHCCNLSNAVGHAGMGRRHAYHCTPYGPLSTAPPGPPRDASVNRYAFTLEAPLFKYRAWRRDRSRTRQDGHHLHRTVCHTSARSQIERRACTSPSPWSIKGR
jgi:hypothetical protein